MNIKDVQIAMTAAFLALAAINTEAQGTTFTYQGRLDSNGAPLNGFYDFEFSLSNAPAGGTQLGATISQTGVGVTNGLFSTALNFGDVFTGNDAWLAISVRSNGVGNYTPLTPLEELTPTPYAIFATSASNLSGTLPAAQLSGAILLTQLPSGVVTNDEGGVTLSNLAISGNLTLPSPTATAGIIYSGGNTWLHSDANDNFYAGPAAGVLAGAGSANTGIGYQSMQSNTNGTNNTAIGYQSLNNNTNGSYNVASGERALFQNTSGNDNTALGRHSLENNTTGTDNTAVGYQALLNDNGSNNTAEGSSALSSIGSGSYNIALGYNAGANYGESESSNILVGSPGVGGDNNMIRIGNGQTTTYIAGAINGNGSGLTNLNASQLTGGTVPLAQLPSSLSLLTDPGTGNIFLGQNTGNPAVTGTHNTAIGDSALNVDTSGGGNTAYGYTAMHDNTTGDYNTAVGFQSLLNNLSGNNNSAYGVNTLFANSVGNNNTAVGNSALQNNSNGSNNVALGYAAMLYSTGDNGVVAVGYEALESNTFVGGFFGTSGNTAVGWEALQGNTSGSANTAVGWLSLNKNVGGYNNTASGFGALVANTSGYNNTAAGFLAMEANETGTNNTAIGSDALAECSTANNNTAIGAESMQSTTGGGNTALGGDTLDANTTGYNNTALGYTALENAVGVDNVAVGVNCLEDVSGGGNTSVGTYSLTSVTEGTGNVALGMYAGYFLSSGSNNIYVGNYGNSSENGIIRIGESGTQTATYLTGTVYVPVLSITGGSDLAEPFKITSGKDGIPAGSVMVIDEKNPGQLKVSCQAYDTRVAGVVSGANGIHPGIQMQQQGLLEGGKNVALTGRVYVRADASNGAIEPGDLLTTSDTPGHAMKVTDHAKAQGAILGKAMTGLSAGKGMVLVLVTLQ